MILAVRYVNYITIAIVIKKPLIVLLSFEFSFFFSYEIDSINRPVSESEFGFQVLKIFQMKNKRRRRKEFWDLSYLGLKSTPNSSSEGS